MLNNRLFVTVGLSALVITVASAQGPSEQTGSGEASSTVAAPATAAPQTPGSPAFVNLSGFSNDYQVGAGDVLDIQVLGHPEMAHGLRVSNSGEISFPMLGLIPVGDLTIFDIEAAIASRLQQKQLMQQPEVMVTVREYHAKPIYVSGAVVNPGEFIMSEELTVADAILLAGGLQFNAADEGLVHRRVPAASETATLSTSGGIEVIKVNLTPLKEGRFLEDALPLRRGDVVIVPEQYMNAFYVVGEVTDPRNFFYQPTRTLMASQAISWAGGPTRTAKMSDGMLVRYDEQGKREELKVDYAAILKGNQPDFAVRPNDIIFIPGSRVKTIGHGLLLLTDTMVMSTSFRVARSYQMPDAPPPPTREIR